jgi:nitrite reductase/ring-hydroxylating ferredoxin subunit
MIRFDVSGRTDAVPDGEARQFEVAGEFLCVVHYDGCIYALNNVCNHGRAFSSSGFCDVAEGVMECPLHGGLFDFRTGEPKGPPAEKNAETYEIRTSEGRLLVHWPNE